MDKKGKHAQEKKRRKLKINPKAFTIRVIILLIIIGIVIYITSRNKEEVANQENEEQKSQDSIETSTGEEVTEEIKDEEEIVEETIDTEVEQLINQIRLENNLDENNFYFFYYNLEEKKYYFYNENVYFTAASTIKVPVAMLYYDKISEGKLSLSDTIVFQNDDYEAGGGSTAANYSVGDSVPISYLLEQTIVNSDNTALNMLIHNIGYRQCKEELTKYTDVELSEDFYTSNIANVAYYYDVLQYLYQNSEKYSQLIEYMKKSSGGMYLKENLPQYDVAHKYGSYNGYVHDYGIVYGENTYLIGVFTNGIPDASDLIARIGQEIVECVENEKTEQTTENNTNII